MTIREGRDNDITGILKVLKASLGEISSQKTEAVWNYKHIQNPFGKSLVLVAEEDGQIVGVRAFMRWKWQINSKIYSAFRAVDTATHPDYQGRGIFKKLTHKALEIAEEGGEHFVFNTPNSNSKPGYLKMGWKEIGNLKVQIAPALPYLWFTGSQKSIASYDGNLDDLLEQNLKNQFNGKLFTPKTRRFLRWRYEENPLQKYEVISNSDFYIACYLKRRGRWREFRISEKIYLNKNAEKKANAIIKMLSKNYAAHFITTSSKAPFSLLRYIGNLGPTLTLKNVNLDDIDSNELMNMNTWNYSLGDLELF